MAKDEQRMRTTTITCDRCGKVLPNEESLVEYGDNDFCGECSTAYQEFNNALAEDNLSRRKRFLLGHDVAREIRQDRRA